jgi:hypothetical protein
VMHFGLVAVYCGVVACEYYRMDRGLSFKSFLKCSHIDSRVYDLHRLASVGIRVVNIWNPLSDNMVSYSYLFNQLLIILI